MACTLSDILQFLFNCVVITLWGTSYIVSRSQTTFARRERVWYNAYARLVQNPPELGD